MADVHLRRCPGFLDARSIDGTEGFISCPWCAERGRPAPDLIVLGLIAMTGATKENCNA